VNDTRRTGQWPSREDDQLTDVVNRERSRLGSFIRRRVSDPRDAEDILQDVFRALVEANRLLMPIDRVTSWLFRVARNRITDLYRTRTPERLELEDLLPSPDAGPVTEARLTVPRPCALDENLPHRERGDGEEVRAAVELADALGGEADEGLVDERGGLNGLPRPLAPHVAGRDAPQLVVDERHQIGDAI